jgi:PadR family transcriptional regulator, regulatory protein PadR
MEVMPLRNMKRTYLGEFEELVLLTVAVLAGKAYGVVITHEIIRQTGRSVRLNQVHASLLRLEEKAMVVSRMGEPTPERGGRRKRLFSITAYGQQTLSDIQAIRNHMWSLLPETN